MDVTRSTHTNLDVMQEKRIDDSWNVDSSRHLSNSWKGFTKLTLLKEKPPKGYMWSGERLSKIQTTTTPDHVLCVQKFGRKMVKPLRIENNRNGQEQNPKLDNARTTRGIHFVDPDDEAYKEILENGRRKLEKPMAPPMPCERPPNSITKVVAKLNSASEEKFQNN